MSLAAENFKVINGWRRQSASQFIQHFGADTGSCCENARAWVRAMGKSFDAENQEGHGLSSPLWIKQRFKWGPTSWPIHWCEAVKLKQLDCGALGILARETFMNRGLEAYPAQVIQKASIHSTKQWTNWWHSQPQKANFKWVDSAEVVYHEVVLVLDAGDAEKGLTRLYDPTEGVWMTTKRLGDHRILSIRTEAPVVVEFEGLELVPERWIDV